MKRMGLSCAVEICEGQTKAFGLCNVHYQRVRRNGRSELKSLQERFWEKVNKTETCWLWTASSVDGYGGFRVGEKMQRAHRVAYEWEIGRVPDGLELDHLCRTRLCVNPAHLEPVTRQENVIRGAGLAAKNASKTHCLRGHEFSEANIYRQPSTPLKRRCLICKRTRAARAA